MRGDFENEVIEEPRSVTLGEVGLLRFRTEGISR